MIKNQLPQIALIGRPNVGKSSLFNRLIQQRKAITSNIAGTTRDRLFAKVEIQEYQCQLIDTAGIEWQSNDPLLHEAQFQAEQARDQADLIFFLVDATKELTSEDYKIADILRKQSKKVILVANKADNPKLKENTYSWAELGFGVPISISVIHNFNIEYLIDLAADQLEILGFERPKVSIEEDANSEDYDEHESKRVKNTLTVSEPNSTLNLAFIGRPNAGKSSLINAIIGEKRLTVSDIPGTTRDSVDVELDFKGRHFQLVDTAGIRRRGKIEKGIEKYSIFRTLHAIEKSDIVCLILDYSVGIRAQDLHISEYALENGKGLILIVNKYDLMEDKENEKNRILNVLRRRFDFLAWAPVIFTSALEKKNISVIFELANSIDLERNKIIPDEDLTSYITEIVHTHRPPTKGRKRLQYYQIKQVGTKPPTFELLVNDTEISHFSYERYMENKFREKYGFNGTVIDFIIRPIDPKLIKKSIAL